MYLIFNIMIILSILIILVIFVNIYEPNCNKCNKPLAKYPLGLGNEYLEYCDNPNCKNNINK